MFSKIRSIPVVCVLVATFVSAFPCSGATDVMCQIAIGKKNKSASTKYTDFHLVVESDTNLTLDTDWDIVRDSGGTHHGTATDNGTHTVTVDWTGLNIEPGKAIGGTIRFKQVAKNYYKVTKTDFTHSGGAAAGTGSVFVPIPNLGLRVESNGDYYLTNDYDESISYSGIQYVVQSGDLTETPVELADLLAGIAEGTTSFPYNWTTLPDGSVPANTEQLLISLSIAPGQFLFAFFEASFASDPTDESYVLQGHEHQAMDIPAVSEWGIAVLALVLLGAGTIIFRRRLRAVQACTVLALVLVTQLPATATPPAADAAELAKWNDSTKVDDNNCYNYGTNSQNNKYAQPGWTDPLQRSWAGMGTLTAAELCAEITLRAVKDGLEVVQGSATVGDPEPDDPNLIALVVKTGWDYHWYRRDGNDEWSHKPGGGDARTYHGAGSEAAGPKVTDPRDSTQTEDYNTFCGYFTVSKPAPGLDGLLVSANIPDTGIRCISLENSGRPDPFRDLVGSTALDVILRLPTQEFTNEVSNPGWSVPIGQTAFDLIPGADFVSSMPPLVRVSEGIVAIYSDIEGEPPRFYQDDRGLGAMLQDGHDIPTVSAWGLSVMTLLALTAGTVVLGRRRQAAAA